jgi:hypothetical protein
VIRFGKILLDNETLRASRDDRRAFLGRYGAVMLDTSALDPEPEEQCGQCGAVVLGYHACQGVPE